MADKDLEADEAVDRLNEAPHECRDIVADQITGVQIGTMGHKLWVCVDGSCVLRIRSPEIELTDMRDGQPTLSEEEILADYWDSE